MKLIGLTLIGVCAVGLCLAQVPGTATHKNGTPQKADSSGTCLLGSDCLRMSKIPLKACLVGKDRKTLKDSKTPDACAVDGMKLIGKFEIAERRT